MVSNLFQMFSPLSRGKGFQSVSVMKRRRRALKIRLILTFLSIILLFLGIVFLSRLSSIRIQKIYSSGNTILSDDDILSSTRELLSGNIYFLFPRNNILYFSRANIERELLLKYPEIEKAKVSFKNFQSISVIVKEREPKALWCAEGDISLDTEEGIQSEESCYLVDGNGLIFRKAGDYTASWFLKFEGGILGNPIGQSVMDKEEFKTSLLFTEALSKDNLSIKRILIKEGGVREGEFNVGGKIIWNADQNLLAIITNLKTLIKNPEFKGKKDGVLSVEYIDIQNSNKIFYKAR